MATLETTAWVLESAPGIDLPPGGSPSATFADGRVSGSTGCNRFTAAYALEGDQLELGMIASTRMACAPPLLSVEQAYVAALGRVARWRIEGEVLTLSDEQGSELLRFAPGDATRYG